MIETPARTDQSCYDEPRDDDAAGVATHPQDDPDEYDETPDEDTSPLTPLWGAAEFAELVAEMVAEEAPRLFAVVQEYGEQVDGRIAAWGIAFDDHADVVGVDGGAYLGLRSLERLARRFSRPNITARVVWVNPDAATPLEEIDAT